MLVEVDAHALKHGLKEPEIRYAWSHYLRKQPRRAPEEDRVIAIGSDGRGRLIQMVGVAGAHGVLIYHAMTPPTKAFMKELGLLGRQR